MGVLIGGGIVYFYAGLGGMKGITLHPSCPILCYGLCLHHTGHFHFFDHYW